MISKFLLATVCFVAATSIVQAQNAPDARRLIESAKPGATVQLPAGTFAIGDVRVPAGTKVEGAGYEKTILDAKGAANGLLLTGAKTAVANLTIRGARETGLKIDNAQQTTIRGVRLTGNLSGAVVNRAANVRLENCIFDANRTGLSLTHVQNSVAVNCTLVDNTALALGVADAQNTAIFNSLLVDSPTGVYLGRDNRKLALDHNLYITNVIGKLEGEVPRKILQSWTRLTGHDPHSVNLPLTFVAPKSGDFRSISTLPWQLDRPTTSNWGVGELNGFAAPAKDIAGHKRGAVPDLGAFETTVTAPRPADGHFRVSEAQGVKSAGIFTRDGFNIAYLFHNLPLPAGDYSFWVPSRDYQGHAIAPGDYEVRLVESNLSNQYVALAGNFARSTEPKDIFSFSEQLLAFDAQNRVYAAQGWSENGQQLRAFDADFEKSRWVVAGGATPVGLAAGPDGVWLMTVVNDKGDLRLRRFNQETGAIMPFADGSPQKDFAAHFSASARGLALLNGTLFFADATQNRVYYAPVENPTFEKWFEVAAPSGTAADAKNGLIWVVSGGKKLVALDAKSGAVKAQSSLVPSPAGVAVANGELAVLSLQTGKIHLLDASDPQHLREMRTIGSGDGPYGPIRADRFWFQQPNVAKNDVALSASGNVAVIDGPRIGFWDADNQLKRQGLGFWGQHLTYGRFAGDTDERFWNIDGRYSMKLDSKSGSWAPDTLWQLPDFNYVGRAPRGFFSRAGRNFGTYTVNLDPDPKKTQEAFVLIEFEGFVGKARALYFVEPGAGLSVRRDTNGDGQINDADAPAQPVMDAAGKRITRFPEARSNGVQSNGDFVLTGSPTPDATATVIPFVIDAGGAAAYDWAKSSLLRGVAHGAETAAITSPYDFKTPEMVNSFALQVPPLSDGGYAASISLKTSGGTGLNNSAGTDIAGFSPQGELRWIHLFRDVPGTNGVQTIPAKGLVLTMFTEEDSYHVMDEDGLGLGVLGLPPEVNWKGMWSDHAQQQQAWLGNDGQPYYVLGDYSLNGYHWFRITGADAVRHEKFPFLIAAPKAKQLAALPVVLPAPKPQPPATQVTLTRLPAPLPIDGDLKKWRNIPVAALITPETASGAIGGPADCSAVVRLAYQGSDLYVQTLVFDDVVTFHQPSTQMFQQDGIEMAINGFLAPGFKFNVGLTTDGGPTVMRDRFVTPALTRIYSPQQVPRVIKVLDNARDVDERRLIEAVYGVDLSHSKVIVTEFKLPLAVAFEGDEKSAPAAGGNFYIGFYINDNDLPGSDIQDLLAWPATYGPFVVKERGARVSFGNSPAP